MISPGTAVIAAMLAAGPPQSPSWTWTLYEGDSPVVFANELPDTDQLKTTLECAPGSGLIRISVYQTTLRAGFATVASGEASATVEASASPDGAVVVPVRADHPVFSRFANTGGLSIAVGDVRWPVQVQPPYMIQLRRFADLCGA